MEFGREKKSSLLPTGCGGDVSALSLPQKNTRGKFATGVLDSSQCSGSEFRRLLKPHRREKHENLPCDNSYLPASVSEAKSEKGEPTKSFLRRQVSSSLSETDQPHLRRVVTFNE